MSHFNSSTIFLFSSVTTVGLEPTPPCPETTHSNATFAQGICSPLHLVITCENRNYFILFFLNCQRAVKHLLRFVSFLTLSLYSDSFIKSTSFFNKKPSEDFHLGGFLCSLELYGYVSLHSHTKTLAAAIHKATTPSAANNHLMCRSGFH